jgi:hypothetical protein
MVEVEKKPIHLATKAVENALCYHLSSKLIEKIVWNSNHTFVTDFGVRFRATCEEFPDQIIIDSFERGRV